MSGQSHPPWGLDHFVLVVGYDGDALLMNSTWGQQVRRTEVELATATRGFAFHNRSHRYFAFAIRGFAARPADAIPVTLVVRSETPAHLDVSVVVKGLEMGASYRLERYALGESEPEWTHVFTATAREREFAARVTRQDSAVFRCLPGAKPAAQDSGGVARRAPRKRSARRSSSADADAAR